MRIQISNWTIQSENNIFHLNNSQSNNIRYMDFNCCEKCQAHEQFLQTNAKFPTIKPFIDFNTKKWKRTSTHSVLNLYDIDINYIT